MRVLEMRSPPSVAFSNGAKPTLRRSKYPVHECDVAGTLVPESKTRTDDYGAYAELVDESVEKHLRRERRDAIVERDEKTLLEAGRRKGGDAFFRRAQQRRFGSRAQKCRRMVGKRQHARTPPRPAHPQRLLRDRAMPAMKSVEEADCERERTRRVSLEPVRNARAHTSTSTLRGARSAPSASPTPTSVRDSSRTKT